MQHVLAGKQFADKKLLEKILARAEEFEALHKKDRLPKLLDGKIVATLFYEPSTRTRLSFEAAANRLGARVISTENAQANSSAFKGETIEDTVRAVDKYADVIIIRHPEKGSAERAARATSVPIVNAGDGAHEHPTQAVLDMYTIKKEMGRLDKLTVAFVGDMLYGRTVHSLLPLLSLYTDNKLYFVSPPELVLLKELQKELKDNKIEFQITQNLDEALKNADVIYMTRVQKERFDDIEDYKNVKDAFLLKPVHLKLMKEQAIIMHPLPRVNEIDPSIDADPRAAYFRQAQNGLYTRMALLLYSLDL
jgi:aspartate carbamoyltransferase catalytic subunit